MKKIIIILIVIILGLAGWAFFLNNERGKLLVNVSFTSTESDAEVTVYNKHTDSEVSKFSGSSNQKLRFGSYYYIVSGQDYSDQQINFKVSEDNQTISINPDYSDQKLRDLLAEKKSATEKVINDTYPDLMKQYSIVSDSLYKRGQWYGGLLRPNIEETDIGDYYRVVLKKDANQNWQIIRYPEIVLTSANYPDVPVDVLRGVNGLVN